jgi:hypothetical protein
MAGSAVEVRRGTGGLPFSEPLIGRQAYACPLEAARSRQPDGCFPVTAHVSQRTQMRVNHEHHNGGKEK